MVFPAVIPAQTKAEQRSFRCMVRFKITVAGEEGLEPSHAGIKIQCLYQLGDSPTQDTCPVCTAQETQKCRRLRIHRTD